ncbi:hypothetical protein CEN43_04860 [Fischerella thermalis BR2B]|uniref:hypothetical protein n=1 Tax=Fischerella thermalis TaxID=372787 RepID=UPI000C7FE375|nr:hypothetical protein [Fischerella thermalis]PMB35559.1 hypothetical protein CEN43_04860 [Fischerella thermalis BR2B]
MRSFWWEYLGERFEVIFNLIAGGRWYRHQDTTDPTVVHRCLIIDYPPVENLLGDSEFRIYEYELEELDPAVRSMLFQTLKMDAPEFECSYS